MPKNQSLAQMPLDKNLPMHVVARGKAPKMRHYFAPRRGVPQNWPTAIRVPIEEEVRNFGVNSIEYWTQLRIDAANLNLNFERTKIKNLRPEHKEPQTLAEYLNWWETKSAHWQSLKPRTKDNYQRRFAALIAWSRTLGSPHISKITPSLIREFISSNILPAEEMKATRRTLSVVMSHAVERGTISENPVSKLATFKLPKSENRLQVTLWTKDDVEKYVSAAIDYGWYGGAVLIQGLWDTMARITDVTKWMRSDLIEDDFGHLIIYGTNKSTGDATATPYVSQRFVDLCKNTQGLYLVTQYFNQTMPKNKGKKDPHSLYAELRDDNALKSHFKSVQRRAIANGAPKLALKYLRHSGITQASDLGFSNEQIRANTTHATDAMARERYIRNSTEKAREIAAARGVLGTK